MTKDSRIDLQARLDEAILALHHRGPDSHGTLVVSSGDLRVGLAHTRLSILDPSPAGNQPMTTEDGRCSIVFNGEVYNFREIRRELESKGERFASTGDTEVVLKAYVRWGAGFLERLRGMFALGIWDQDRASLLLARDRLGKKPLYYTAVPGGAAFASEIRALLRTGFARPIIAPHALVGYLGFGSVCDPDTLITDVRSVAPGSAIEVRNGDSLESRFWELPEAPHPGTPAPSGAIADLNRGVGDAVRLRLIADVPVGVFLSGGIDSSAIVSLATQQAQGPIRTITVTFDEKPYDESRFAAEVARTFGCEHHELHVSSSQAVAAIPSAFAAMDQPSSDGFNTFLVARAARETGLKVALSGIGGDEVFGGYSTFRSFPRAVQVARCLRGTSGAFRKLAALDGFAGLPTRARKVCSLLATRGEPAAVYSVFRGMFSYDQCRALIDREVVGETVGTDHIPVSVPPSLECGASPRDVDFVNLYSSLELANYLRNTLLRDSDVMGMAHGLEIRAPFLDHELVEQAARIPGAQKLLRSRQKPLLLDALPRPLPKSAVERTKMGFTLPFDSWLRGPLRPWVEDLLLSPPRRSDPFLNARAVERVWRSFLKGERYASYARVLCLAAFVHWCEAHGVRG